MKYQIGDIIMPEGERYVGYVIGDDETDGYYIVQWYDREIKWRRYTYSEETLDTVENKFLEPL